MPSALTLESMSPGLVKGVERAQREPEGRFHALAHLIDVPALTASLSPCSVPMRRWAWMGSRRSSTGRT